MQTELFDGFAESTDSTFKSQNEDQGFLELLEQSSRVSVRLSNAIRSAAAAQQLPYETIRAYIKDGTLGRLRMSEVKNIGRKSIAELDLLIAEAYEYQSMQILHSDHNALMKPTARSLPETGISEFLDNFCGVNTLLSKAIKTAAASNALPYQTIREYIEAGEPGRERMLEIDGLDQELLAEYDQLLSGSGYRLHTDAYLAADCAYDEALVAKTNNKPSDKEVLSLPLDTFLARQRSVSTRLLNAVSIAVKTGTCPFETIEDYLRRHSRHHELRKIENLGTGSAIEFERLVMRSLGAEATTSIWHNDQGYVDLGSVVKEAFSLLTSRQQDVIFERLLEKKTLEAVASTRGVTRERVRQIEAKSLRVLSTKFGSVLFDSANTICSRLHEDGLFELSLETFSKLVTCEVKEANIYLALLKKIDVHHSTLGIFESNVFVRSHYVPRKTWKETLTEELSAQSLPLSLDKALSSISSVPGFYIRDYFQRKWGQQSIETGTVVPSYGTSRMCIDVLRKAGRPLHTSDVRAQICTLFQIDIEEHAINAALGRNTEVVITAPGTYALYESLPFTRAQIESIRNIAHEYLTMKGVFLSSKILFDQAFVPNINEYQDGLNHYLVMGIVQDDRRFTTKRGNMIGLVTFNLTESYTPLQDEVRRIVLDHGPVTLSEISERVSETRRLCNAGGIRLILSQSSDVIRIGRQTFDSLHRFFATREIYEDLLLAIRISLLEKKKTTYAITQDLGRLQFDKLTQHLVESLLLSMDDVESKDDIHELTSPDHDFFEYNDAVVRTLHEHGAAEDVQARLGSPVSPERLTKLISLDTRFLIDLVSCTITAEDTELDSILRDFDF